MLVGFDALDARRVAERRDDPRCVGEWDLAPTIVREEVSLRPHEGPLLLGSFVVAD